MARKSKKFEEPIVGETVDLRSDFEKKLYSVSVPTYLSASALEEEQPVEPTALQLSKDELFRLQLTQFQARAFDAERALEIFKRDQLLKQIDPEGALQRMMALIRNRTDDAVKAKTEYAAVVQEIEGRLGIKLAEYAYDDLTGTLSKID
jgi:hypothetical protein